MRSRFGSLSFLLVVFIGLTAVYWFGFKDKTAPPTSEPIPTRESVELVTIASAQVQEISWNYQSTKGKISQASENEWKLVEPSIVADGVQSADYARSVLDIKGENRYPFSQLSREDAGLTEPSLTITILAKDKAVEKIIVGKETIDKEFYYVAKDGADFSTLVSSFTIENLKRDPYTLAPIASPTGAGSSIQ